MKVFLKKKTGYVLAWVLSILLVAAILAAGGVSIALLAIRSTEYQHNSRQAYYTARSAADLVANHIIKNPSNENISALVGKKGIGQKTSMGEYSVDVSYVAAEKLKITVTAKYGGETSIVSVYLLKYAPPAGIVPTDKVIYVDGSAEIDFDNAIVQGDIFVNGGLNYGSSMQIYGDVIVTGNSHVGGSGSAAKDFISFGSVEITAGGRVKGNLIAKGDVTLSGGVFIEGGLYIDNSLNFTAGGNIAGDAVVGKNVYFSGGSDKISGKLSYGGRATVGNNTLEYFAPNGIEQITNYQDLDLSAYQPAVLTNVSPPLIGENPKLYQPAQIVSNSIKQSGNLTPIASTLNNMRWTSLSIDTRGGDISLLLDNTPLSFSGLSIDIIGNNRVFLYLKGNNAGITLNQGHFRASDTSKPPSLFIFADANQEINLTGTQLHACVYMPLGTFKAHTYQKDGAIFIGSVIAKHVNVGNLLTLKFSQPDITNTPLESLFTPGSSSSSATSGWYVEGWDKR